MTNAKIKHSIISIIWPFHESGLDLTEVACLYSLFKKYANGMLPLRAFDTEDENIEIIFLGALSKVPSNVDLGFKIDLERLDEQTFI